MPGPAGRTVSLEEIAGELARAEAGPAPVAPLTARFPSLTLDDAYAIQQLRAQARIEAGERIVGHKVGLTSKAMQEQLGVHEPDFGVLFADMALESGAVLDAATLVAPRAEPEVAFVLARPLRGPGVSAADVIAATDHVVASLEIIDSRIADWRINLVDTVADNGSAARFVLSGARHDPSAVALDEIEVVLNVDGVEVQRGLGSAVLGHPAEAVAWLANTLGARGVGLDAGHVVLSGSMTRAEPLPPGARLEADFGVLGPVTIAVSAQAGT